MRIVEFGDLHHILDITYLANLAELACKFTGIVQSFGEFYAQFFLGFHSHKAGVPTVVSA